MRPADHPTCHPGNRKAVLRDLLSPRAPSITLPKPRNFRTAQTKNTPPFQPLPKYPAANNPTQSRPEGFAAIAAEARWRLAAATALVRRYIHILAADIVLPPPAPARPVKETAAPPAAPRRYREPPFRLIEEARLAASPSRRTSERDTPEFQWALTAEAVRRLVAVMADPRPHALRLARFLRERITAALRALPVPHHILRRLPPEIDALVCRFDQAARPGAWEGLDTS